MPDEAGFQYCGDWFPLLQIFEYQKVNIVPLMWRWEAGCISWCKNLTARTWAVRVRLRIIGMVGTWF